MGTMDGAGDIPPTAETKVKITVESGGGAKGMFPT